MAITLLLGSLLFLADGPEYVTVEAGRQTVYEGTALQRIKQEGGEYLSKGRLHLLQIVLDERADGTRQVVRVVTKKPDQGPEETTTGLYFIGPDLCLKQEGVAAVALFGSALPDVPEILDVPLTMEQIELEESATKERPLQIFGQPKQQLTFRTEALDSDLYQITATPAAKLPFEIQEEEQLTNYSEQFTVDPLEERVVGYALEWSMKWGEGTAEYRVKLEETSTRKIDGAELARLQREAQAIVAIQAATYQDTSKAQELLSKFEADSSESALAVTVPGLHKSIDDFRRMQEQQAREEKLVAQLMNKPAPDFTLEGLAGDSVTLSEFTKGKVTLVSFWGYG